MKPTIESIILHPAVLIASGFDCITSGQVRFLNAHRLHFDHQRHQLNETLSITSRDFELGGILNPYCSLHDIDSVYHHAAQHIPNFPYLTRYEILKHFYLKDLSIIWSSMMAELFDDLSQFCVAHKRSRDHFIASTIVIHQLYPNPIYQKISALHLCGLGGKLLDAFDYVFKLFRSFESRAERLEASH